MSKARVARRGFESAQRTQRGQASRHAGMTLTHGKYEQNVIADQPCAVSI
jgi:hypothetical protein